MARPHILLITTDQQRFDALGFNGNPVVETPNLDAVAASGVNFPRCYITCPVCIPARRTLLSGQHPVTHGLRWYEDGLNWDPPFTLPGILSRAGYQTQLVGKMHLHPMGKRYGFDHIILSETSNSRPGSQTQPRNDYARWLRENGIHDHPHFHGISGNGRTVLPWPLEDRWHHNNWIAREATRFLCEDRDSTAPFFLHVSFFHPHPPLVPTRDYFERFLAKDLPPPAIGEWVPDPPPGPGTPVDGAVGPFSREIIERARAAYYALINHIDDCVAHILERWREYGNPRSREPLYVIFSSDHGEMLGDHHLFRKSLGYEASSHVPFFIGGYNVDLTPGICDDLCSWEDVLPTVAELAEAELPGPVDGRSLAPALRGEALAPRPRLTGMCHGQFQNYFQIEGPHSYLWFPKTQEEQVFNVISDPHQNRDLSADENLLAPFRVAMQEFIEKHGGPEFRREELRPCRNQPPSAIYPAIR